MTTNSLAREGERKRKKVRAIQVNRKTGMSGRGRRRRLVLRRSLFSLCIRAAVKCKRVSAGRVHRLGDDV